MSGEMLGTRYRVERELARGGMGKVLLVRDLLLDREVAIKTMLGGSAESAQVRFLEEAQITGQLAHPNVVPVHELGLTGAEMFLAMKRVSGQDLRELIRSLEEGQPEARERYPLGRLLRLFLKVCEAMAYAHERGVIHRDLKPANIMLGEGDEVLVMDWGLARPIGQEGGVVSQARESASAEPGSGQLTQEGAVVGTPAYMPPEQADGEALDATADVYGLGATLYHVLTLRAPYTGSSLQVLSALFKGPPPRPRTIAADVPPALEGIVLKAMSPSREGRYPDAGALAREVEAYLDGRAVSGYREGLREALGRLVRRNRLLFGTIAVAVTLVAAGAALAQTAVRAQKAAADTAQASASDARGLAESAAVQAELARRQSEAVARASEPIRGAAQFVLRCRGPLTLGQVQEEYRTRVGDPLALAEEHLAALPPGDQAAAVVVECRENLTSLGRAADRALAEVLLARDPWLASAELKRLDLGEGRSLLEARALLRQWRPRDALERLRASKPSEDEAVRSASAALRSTLERAPLLEQRKAYEVAIRSAQGEEADWLHGWLLLRLGECLARLGELGSPDDVFSLGLPRTAHGAFARALSLTPNDAWIEASQCRHLVPLNRGVEERRDDLAPEIDRLIELERALHRVWSGPMGALKYKAAGDDKNWNEFVSLLEKTSKQVEQGDRRLPRFVLHRLRAEGALILGKLEEAERCIVQALDAAPRDPEALALHAAIRLRGGQLEEAGEIAVRALAIDREHGRANYVKGEALRRAGRFADAKGHLELGARGSLQFERWLRLAQCLAQSSEPVDWERGITSGRRALELMPVMLDSCDPRVEVVPDDPQVPRVMAQLYERQGKLAHAALLAMRAHLFQLQVGMRWRRGGGPKRFSVNGRDLFVVARLHEELDLLRESHALYGQARRFPNLAAEAKAHMARIVAKLPGSR